MASYYDEFLLLHNCLPGVVTSTLNTIKKCDVAHKKVSDELKKILQLTNEKPNGSTNCDLVKTSRRNKKVIDYNENKKSNPIKDSSAKQSDQSDTNIDVNKVCDLECLKSNSILIQSKLQQLENLSSKKLQLCSALYDVCDQHMKVGSKKLKIMENILKNKNIPTENSRKSLKRNHTELREESSMYHRNDVDAAEPTYCICNQVAFGDMIACENEDCPTEWFHYKCVNLYKAPKSNWLCPNCTYERKQKKKEDNSNMHS